MAETALQENTLCPCAMLHQSPMAWLAVDRNLGVVEGNALFWDEVALRQPVAPGTPLQESVSQDMFESLRGAIAQAMATDQPAHVPGLRILPPGHPHRIIDLVVVPGIIRNRDVLLIASSAVGDVGRRVEELTLLQDMIRVLRQQHDIDRVLFTTLTCATAGSGGLGFNRAWVLLCDADQHWLDGQMALGPASAEDAYRIWGELTSSPRTLDQFADAYDRWVSDLPRPLQNIVQQMRFSMAEDAPQLPVLALAEAQPVHVTDAANDERVGPRLAALLQAREFTVVPMVVSNEPCGVIMADNLYSGAPITEGHLRLLSLFAQHAGMAIEDAQLHREMESHQRELEQAYADLQRAQDQIVRASKLAALGEMSARIAHDLRNPLVTLGGWARVVQEDPNDTATVTTAAKIIAEECASLEQMLSMLLEPFTTRQMRLAPTDLNRLLDDTLQTQEHTAQQQAITVRRNLAPDLPIVPTDPAQFRRCLANLIENAIAAMPLGGTLSAATRLGDSEVLVEIADTGVGMDQDQLAHIFDAFYSTGRYGSGLGLAIVWDVVQSHGFSIDVRSEPGRGSTFTIHIPLAGKH